MKSAARHLLWKECCQLAPVWVTFTALFAMVMFMVTGLPRGDVEIVIPIAMVFCCTFPFAVGIFLFSPERERRTDQLLASFPVASRAVCGAKVRIGIVSVALFLAIVLLVLALFVQEFRAQFRRTSMLNIWNLVILPIECFCWGLFCSMRCRNSLLATFLAAFLLIVSVATAYLVPSVLVPGQLTVETATTISLFIRVGTLVCLAVAIRWTGLSWLRGRRIETGVEKPRTTAAPSARVEEVKPVKTKTWIRRPSGVDRSLIWQSFRQFRWVGVSTLVGLLFSGLILGSTMAPNVVYYPHRSYLFWLVFFCMYLGILMGAFSFGFDQVGQRYRFFQQQAPFARRLWWARLAPPALGCFVGWLVYAGVTLMFVNWMGAGKINSAYGFGDPPWIGDANFWILDHLGPMNVLLLIVSAFAAAQFVSMYFRSTVFTGLFAHVAGISAVVWVQFVIWLDLNTVFFGWPIPLVLLYATWMRAPTWVDDSRSVAKWLNPIANVVVVCLLVAGGVVLIRSNDLKNEVQWQSRELSYPETVAAYQTLKETGAAANLILPLRNPSTSGGVATGSRAAGLYFEALQRYVPAGDIPGAGNVTSVSPPVKDWSADLLQAFVTANREPIELVMEASGKVACFPFLNPNSPQRHDDSRRLLQLLDAQTEMLLRENQLERALDSIFARGHAWRHLETSPIGESNLVPALIGWSQHPGQTRELIDQALERLDEWLRTQREYGTNQRRYQKIEFFDYITDWEQGESVEQFQNPGLVRCLQWFPWEIERSKRAGQVAIDLQFFQYQTAMVRLEDDDQSQFSKQPGARTFAELDGDGERMFMATTRTSLFSPQVPPGYLAQRKVKSIQGFRYLKVRLALRAYQLETGEWPASLDELVPDYLLALPRDVFTGRDFCFQPNGLSLAAVYGNLQRLDRDPERRIPPDTGFLLPWSASPRIWVDRVAPFSAQSREEQEKYYNVSDNQHSPPASALPWPFEFELNRAGDEVKPAGQ